MPNFGNELASIRRSTSSEVSGMLTFAKALIEARNLSIRKFCKEYGKGYDRISKLLNGDRRYRPDAGDAASIAEFLGIHPDLAFQDAGPLLEAHAAGFSKTKKKSEEPRFPRQKGAG